MAGRLFLCYTLPVMRWLVAFGAFVAIWIVAAIVAAPRQAANAARCEAAAAAGADADLYRNAAGCD